MRNRIVERVAVGILTLGLVLAELPMGMVQAMELQPTLVQTSDNQVEYISSLTENSIKDVPTVGEEDTLKASKRLLAAEIAEGQVGTEGGSKYYNKGESGAWCAYFARWCARQVGLDSSQWGNTGSTTLLIKWFQQRNWWHNKVSYKWSYNGISSGGTIDPYVPQPGDFAAIENNGKDADGPGHTGIVHSVNLSTNELVLIEGNISNKVVKRTYRLSNLYLTSGSKSENAKVHIVGFGEPDYGEGRLPVGYVDSVEGGKGTITVKGWAFDTDVPSQALDLHVYVGNNAYIIKADKLRPDVNTAYGGNIGDNHGYEQVIQVNERGNQTVRVYAINVGENGVHNPLLGSANVYIDEVQGNKRERAAELAYSQIGATDGNKYCESGEKGNPWGVYFVRWCARQAGLTSNEWGNTGSTTQLVVWFKERNRWHNKVDYTWSYNDITDGGTVEAYAPQIGDFVAIESNGNASDGPDNAGIVYKLDVLSDTITLIHGNINNMVVERTYSLSTLFLTSGSVTENSRTYIVGYGAPDYGDKTTSITFGKNNIVAKVGDEIELPFSFTGDIVKNASFEWDTEKMELVELKDFTWDNKAGKLVCKAVKAGEFNIELILKDKNNNALLKKSIPVTILQPVTQVTLNKYSLELKKGTSDTLIATVSPVNATNKELVWVSGDSSIATVNSSGVVTAKAVGSVYITASANNGVKAVCLVTVKEVVEFADVEKDGWKYEPVLYAYKNGLMVGTGTDTAGRVYFEPDDVLSRAEFAQILYSAAGKPTVAYSATFSDVETGMWYTDAILWAAKKGIVSGYDNGMYGVNDNITREQLVLMLYKYAQLKGYDTTARADISQFVDKNKVNTWSEEQVRWAGANGIISGKPNPNGSVSIDPQGPATRAECAAMMRKFMQKFEG